MFTNSPKNNALHVAFRAIEILIAIFLATMVFFTFLNVVLRFVFNTGLAWSEELTRLSFIYLVYLGAIVAARDNAHLMVDTLISHVPKKAQSAIYVVIQLITIWLMGLLTYGSWQWAMMKRGDIWPITRFPVFLINISGAVLGIAYILICISNLVKLFAGKEDPMALLTPYTETLEEPSSKEGENK